MIFRLNVLALSFVLLGSLSACQKHDTASTAQPEAAKSTVPVATAAKLEIGQKARCPVSGEEFVVKAETTQVEHDGKHYAFCCPDCQPTFEKNPAKYAAKN